MIGTIFSDFFEFFQADEEKNDILKVLPSFFSLDVQCRQEKFDSGLKELSYFFEKNNENKDYKIFLMNKLKPYIYLTPFSDVKEKAISFAKYYLINLEEDHVSSFYDQDKIVSIIHLAEFLENPIKKNLHPSIELPEKLKLEEFKYLLGDIVNFNGGKITHLDRLLCWFPDYLAKHFQTKNCLMTVPGALPLDWRFYIGIMAVAIYGCDYLFNHLVNQFLTYGGEKEWIIKGIDAAPMRLKKLRELNSVLAHKPWSLRADSLNIIKELLKGKDQWSIPELMHAMTILSYFHAWACFCMANGLQLESDMNFFNKEIKTVFSEDKNFPQEAYESKKNEEIIDLLTKIKEEEQLEDVNGVNSNEMRKKNKILLHCPEDFMFDSIEECPKANVSCVAYYKFLASEPGKNEDFNYHKYQLLKSHDYSFGTHGVALFNEFLPELANSLQEELNYLFKMTKNSFETKKEIDTEPFRRAIRYYTENIYGYYHEHYDYAQYNKLMPKKFKEFIKMIVKTPFEITRHTSKKSQIQILDFEICHVTLLAILARLQVSMVYTLESLGRFLYDKQ